MKSEAVGAFKALMPILTYCLCSMSMIFTNKLVLSVYEFHYAATLLVFQSLVAVLLLVAMATFGFIHLEPFSLETARKWSPVTVLFGLMLYTGSKTLTHLNIPVMTVFKNMTNLLIAFGDWYFFSQTVSNGIIASFLMMTVGSFLVGYYDLEYSFEGYCWMACNCLAQTGYVLYMKRAKSITQLTEWGMSFYNNLLCVLLMSVSAVLSGEVQQVAQYPGLTNANFIVSMVFGGMIGTGLSLSVFWCISATSPTTYSMVGALNKIPITFISIVFFNVMMDWKTMISVSIGLAAGIVYTMAKLRLNQQSKAKKSVEEGVKGPKR